MPIWVLESAQVMHGKSPKFGLKLRMQDMALADVSTWQVDDGLSARLDELQAIISAIYLPAMDLSAICLSAICLSATLISAIDPSGAARPARLRSVDADSDARMGDALPPPPHSPVKDHDSTFLIWQVLAAAGCEQLDDLAPFDNLLKCLKAAHREEVLSRSGSAF